VERSGKDVLVISELHKAYGEQVIFSGLSRGVYAGDRVAIIGPNGVGKTTLLKMLAGELEADSGEIRYGANVKVGYFAQHHTELLDTRRTVLEEVRLTCPKAGESFVRGVCGAFLFSGDDVDKPVGILSGGERARVLLARLLANPGNLLLMDEPTTHLDLNASEALAEALAGFGGTLVLVSHNTAFVNHLATKIWDVRDGDVIEYPGNLAEYLEHQARADSDALLETETDPETETESESETGTEIESGPAGKHVEGAGKETRQERQERKRMEAERRNELSRRTRAARERIEALEAEITELEREQAELEPRLADPALHADGPRFREELRRYEEIKRRQEELVRRWEQQQAELEAIEAEFENGG
jgi:ATP-binding cassette subfamily F protein 3